MGRFGRRERGPKARPSRRPEAEPRAANAADPDEDESLRCVLCGALLGFDPEDEPNGEGPGRHVCGECNRARNFDNDLQTMWWHGDIDI